MKKKIFFVLAATMLLLTNGCSGGGGNSNNLSSKVETEDAVEAYIKDNLTEKCSNMLYEGSDSISVLIVSEKANIKIKAFADFCIPPVAEELLPVATEALEKNGVELGEISVAYYRMNNDGVVDGSMVDWTTKDGEKGTFASEPDGVVEPGYSIADLQEYYKDYGELVERIQNGEEVNHE